MILRLKFINYINLDLQTYSFMKLLLKLFSVNLIHITNTFILQLILVFISMYANNFVILNTLGKSNDSERILIE